MNFLITLKSLFERRGVTEAQRALASLQKQSEIIKPRNLLGSANDLDNVDNSATKAHISTAQLANQLNRTNRALHATEALARGDVFGALTQSASALGQKLGTLGTRISGALAGLSIGWQLGSMIRETTGLARALDRLVVPPRLVANSIRDLSTARLAGLKGELSTLSTLFDSLVKMADAASKRIDAVLQSKLSGQLAPLQEKLLAAPPEERPVIKAQMTVVETKTRRDIAEATNAEDIKALAAAEARLANLREQLKTAEELQNTLAEKASELDPFTGKPEPQTQSQLVELRTAQERVDSLRTATLNLAEEIDTIREKELRSQTALKNAVMATRDAEQAVLDVQKEAADARQKAADQKAKELRTLELELSKVRVEQANDRVEVANKQAEEDLQKKQNAAAEQRQFANDVAANADRARERFLNPAVARQEKRAAKEQQREDERISKLAAKARAAGFQIQWAPGGEAQAVKVGNVGPDSPRLRRALELDEMRRRARREQGNAQDAERAAGIAVRQLLERRRQQENERIQVDAAKASIEAKRILEQIAENTKAGPIV